VPITLTATITSHSTSTTKPFIVMVKAQVTDAQAVAAAKAALAIVFGEGDSASSVTQNLDLPVTGSGNCTITWTSTDNSVIATDGGVSRPATGDAEITLTATISSHGVSDTLDFPLIVKGVISDVDAVAAALADLHIIYASGDSAAHVTQNVSLPLTGTDACTITWASDTPLVISDQGVVSTPEGNPLMVTLTATVSSHAYSDTRPFVLTVVPVLNDVDAVAADKATLTIGYGPGDSDSKVTGNIFLPTSAANGSTISWTSSNPAVITSSGGVTVPADSDAIVTMTATITCGGASDTAAFPMTVKALLLSEWININAISPGNGAIEVDPGIAVRIPFQMPLNPGTVNDTTFQIVQTSNSQLVPITVNYDVDDPSHTVTLTPLAPLAQDTQYSTIVGNTLRDADDVALPSGMGFSFTTLSYADILSQWKFNGGGSDASGHGNLFTMVDEFGDPNTDYVSDLMHEGSGSLYLGGMWQYGTSNINLGSQLTVAVWINADNPIHDSLNTLMSNTNTGEQSNGFKLCINRWNTSDRSVVIEVGNGTTGGKWGTSGGLIQPGTWYHLAFVIDQPNHSLKIYYNGVQAPLMFTSDQGFLESQFQYNFKTAGPFTIGAFPGGMNFNYKGHLDDMRVYNRVLSDEEVAKIAQEK
jgi:hypothetical protein